jgi:hypothetical protein
MRAIFRGKVRGRGMSFTHWLHNICVVFVVFFCFLVPFAGVHGAGEQEKYGLVGLIDVSECEGVEVTQCELAKNLIINLRMGEDLTCEACFIHLQALGIAPGEDWSYEDPHTVVTLDETKEVILKVHQAYNDGTVRLDGFEAAAGLSDFCRAMKGPPPTPPPSEQEKKETEMQPTTPSQGPQDQGPAPAAEVEEGENPSVSDTQEPGMQPETSE